MPALSKPEVFRALQYTKNLSEREGAAILKRFRQDQPALCEMIFGGLAPAITREDTGLGHLFMDLCFDILCVYQLTHGDLPKHIADSPWLFNKMAALQAEMLSSAKAGTVSQPAASQAAGNTQAALLEYLDMAVVDYIEGGSVKQDAGIAATNMLLAVTRIFDALYSEPPVTRH